MNIKIRDLPAQEMLEQEFDLVGEHSHEAHYYSIQTELATHSSTGQWIRLNSNRS